MQALQWGRATTKAKGTMHTKAEGISAWFCSTPSLLLWDPERVRIKGRAFPRLTWLSRHSIGMNGAAVLPLQGPVGR